MTDRELLEAAAKAAGINYEYGIGIRSHDDFNEFVFWNPLIDDGDALRLAVKLGLRVGTDGQSLHPHIECWRPHYNEPRVFWPVGNDPYAATRRAIVRAATEIGRQA